jgi:hypothetical protein
MAKVMTIFLSFLTLKLYADLDSGRFVGTDSSGQPCEITVGEVSFVNGVKHPLNERVTVIHNTQSWELAHPKVLNEEEGKVRFNHNYFEGLITIAKDSRFGAQYLKMTINHDAEPHRPTSFLYISDDYRDSLRNLKIECINLKKEDRL